MSSISKTTMSSPEKPRHYSSRVKVPLPKFDGSPLDWKRFLELFTSIIEKDVSLSESEKCCLLTDAMSTPETKELVEAATLGSDGYNQGIRALCQKYGRERMIFREHLQQLTRKKTFGYNAKDMAYTVETWSTHIRGLQDCGAYKATHILATLLESQFDSELAHQWALVSLDTNEPSNMEDLLKFLTARLNSALPQESLRKPASAPQPSKHLKSPPPAKSHRTVYKISNNATIPCCICSNTGHGMAKCPTFLS